MCNSKVSPLSDILCVYSGHDFSTKVKFIQIQVQGELFNLLDEGELRHLMRNQVLNYKLKSSTFALQV